MADQKPTPTLVVFVTKHGVHEVQVHTPNRRAEAEATRLYERLRRVVDRLDRVARCEQ